MKLSSQLLVGGGSLYVVLGGTHVLWSLADLRRPRRFAPSEPEVLDAMARSTVRVTSGRTTMWEAWLGFNISHGLGAVLFGCMTVLLGLFQGGLFVEPLPLALLVGVSLIYLVLAVRFWFYLPVVGIAVATVCFGGALVLAVLGE